MIEYKYITNMDVKIKFKKIKNKSMIKINFLTSLHARL